MSIGNVLIRPQMLNRRAINDEAQLVDLLSGLASRLLEDFLRGGVASRKIVQAVEESQVVFVGQFIPKLGTVRGKLMLFLKPYLDTLEAAKNPSTDIEGLLKIVDAAADLANKLIDDLHTERIGGRLNELVDIVENDLGVSREGFENFFLDCLDKVEMRLSEDFLNGTQNEETLNNFLLSIQIRSARRQVRALLALFPLPEVNIRHSIRDLELELTRAGWDESLDKLRQSLTEAKDKLPDLLGGLGDTFNIGSPSSSRPQKRILGDLSAPCEYSWYASEVEGDAVILENRFELTEELAAKIRFGVFPIEFMEHWTHWGHVALEILATIGNVRNVDRGNFWSPFLSSINRGSEAIFSFISIFIKTAGWADFMKIKQNDWFKLGLDEGLVLAGSFENIPDGWAWLWSIWQQDRADAGDAQAFHLPESLSFLEPEKLHELSLSLFTLINADDTEGCENQDEHGGLRDFCKEIVAEHITKRYLHGKFYHAPFDDFGSTAVIYLAGGATIWAADIVGWLVSLAFSRQLGKAAAAYWGDHDFGKRFLKGDNAYGAFLYAFKEFHGAYDLEGDTEGGKYGLKKTTTNGLHEFEHTEFEGYPPRGTSPYHLPFGGSDVVFCSQTHRGRSSHNNYTGLIYAVDFLLQKGKTVLAMRGGTVVDFADHNRTGSDNKNYIIIRHDNLSAEHDKNDTGQIVPTYARYENSEPFGIRRAFASVGITADRIIGNQIPQGAPLFILDKRTGFFNVDHLQVYVSAETTDGILPTIPFVFKEIDGDGVPEKGKYYASSNVQFDPLSISRYQPDACIGLVQSSGHDFIVLEENAHFDSDFYKNAHVFITIPMSNGQTHFEYQTIKSYNGGDRKLTIEGNWTIGFPPPIGTHYRIGSKLFRASTAFDKRFGFIAAQGAEKIADERPPYTWAEIAHFNKPIAEGAIVGAGLKDTNEVHLNGTVSLEVANFLGRHIAIFRNNKLRQYRLIQAVTVELGLTKLKVEGVWDFNLNPTTDTFAIGGLPHFRETEPIRGSFLLPIST